MCPRWYIVCVLLVYDARKGSDSSMTPEQVSQIVNIACKMATKAAMDGTPFAGMGWIPPRTALDPITGMFATMYAGPYAGSDTPPWEQ